MRVGGQILFFAYYLTPYEVAAERSAGWIRLTETPVLLDRQNCVQHKEALFPLYTSGMGRFFEKRFRGIVKIKVQSCK